jgi:hypothetical protein
MSLAEFLQFTTTLAIIATLYIYHRQLRIMEGQLEASLNASAAQNLISLTSMLQAEDARKARTHLLTITRKKDYKSWDEEDKRAAAKVCATYGPAGAILKTNLVPRAPVLSNWGPSIRDCYHVLKPFIQEMQKPDKGGPDYLANIVWLYEQIKGSTR